MSRLLAQLLALVLAALPAASTPSPVTITDYNLMGQRSAGQIWAGAMPVSQWAWSPQPDGTSRIAWGESATWPPASYEVFRRDGDWLVLDGWQDNGTFYDLIADTQYAVVGGSEVDLPAGTWQDYALWTIPDASYQLFAAGRVIEQATGREVRFAHWQEWSRSDACPNAYNQPRPCVAQHERWWDDNGSPYELRLDRTTTYAQGAGPGWTIRQTIPKPWTADLRYWWEW